MMNRVMHMDCIQFLDSLESDVRFDMVLADPPYNHGLDFGNASDRRKMDEWVQWMQDWINPCLKRLKPHGLIYCYGWPEQMVYVMAKYGLDQIRHLVWQRYNGVMTPRFWVRSHESIWCIWNRDSKATLLMDQIREPYAQAGGAGKKVMKSRVSPWARASRDKDTFVEKHPDGRYATDILYAALVRGGKGKANRGAFYCKKCEKLAWDTEGPEHWECGDENLIRHPTQKPPEITERLIKSKCAKGGDHTIYIPFAGSGSECVTAKRMGVDFYATEITEDYVFLGNVRLDHEDEKYEWAKPEEFKLGEEFHGSHR